MKLLKSFSSNQFATFVGCAAFAVKSSHLEKTTSLVCPSSLKTKTYYQIGSFACMKTVEILGGKAIEIFAKKESEELPFYRLSEKSSSSKTSKAFHLALGIWAGYEMVSNLTSLYEDGSLLAQDTDNLLSNLCAGYILSSLLASAGKIQICCQTLFKTLSLFKDAETLDY